LVGLLFLPDPLDVPDEVVIYLAKQLDIDTIDELIRYTAQDSRSPGQMQGGALPLVTDLQAHENVNIYPCPARDQQSCGNWR
jgi:hypothetical protein